MGHVVFADKISEKNQTVGIYICRGKATIKIVCNGNLFCAISFLVK